MISLGSRRFDGAGSGPLVWILLPILTLGSAVPSSGGAGLADKSSLHSDSGFDSARERGLVVQRERFPADTVRRGPAQDLLSVVADLNFDARSHRLLGSATLTLRIDLPTDTLRLLAGPIEIRSLEFALRGSRLRSSSFEAAGDLLLVAADSTLSPGDTAIVTIAYVAGAQAGLRAGSAEDGRARPFWTVSWPHAWRHWLPGGDRPGDPASVEVWIQTDTTRSLVGWPHSADSTTTGAPVRLTRIWSSTAIDVRHAGFAGGPVRRLDDEVLPSGDPIRITYAVDRRQSQLPGPFAVLPEIVAFHRSRLGVRHPDRDVVVAAVGDVGAGELAQASGILPEFAGKSAVDVEDETGLHLRLARTSAFSWLTALAAPADWNDLWLQYGLAEYLALLFLEHDRGADALAVELHDLRSEYLDHGDTEGALARAGWQNPDREISLSRGRVVWMLHEFRLTFGARTFWDCVAAYLTDPGAAAADDFVRAAAAAAGRAAATFLEQRFFRGGHPELRVAYEFDNVADTIRLRIDQLQDGPLVPELFELDLAVEVHTITGVARHEVWLDAASKIFELESEFRPRCIVLDPGGTFLSQIEVVQDPSAVAVQLRASEQISARLLAAAAASESSDEGLLIGLVDALRLTDEIAVKTAIVRAVASHADTVAVPNYLLGGLGDPERVVRQASALGLQRFVASPDVSAALLAAANGDSDGRVQAASVESLVRGGFKGRDRLVRAALITDSERDVIRATAMRTIPLLDWTAEQKVDVAITHLAPTTSTPVRLEALRLAAHLQDRRTVRPMIELLDDPSVAVRKGAAASLSYVDSPSLRARVVRALSQPNTPEVEWTASETLELLGTVE